MHLQHWALQGLLTRYTEILRQTWRIRHELDAPARPRYEAEFLPAHLELAETPIHPASLWAIRTIGTLALLVLALAVFGRLDVVAVAQGKLVPNARVKVIQPAVTGVVRGIRVRNGSQVAAGQLLLELDPSQAAADTNKTGIARLDAQLALSRARALLKAQRDGEPPRVEIVDGAARERQEQVQAYATGVYSEYRNKLASLQALLTQRNAELATARDEIEKLKVIAPLARQQARDYEALVATNYVARHAYLEKEQNAVQAEGDLRTQMDRAVELSAAVQLQQQEIATTTAAFQRAQLAEVEKAQQDLAQLTDDHTKALVRERLMTLTAPVAGTVQNLAIHTVGGVVTTAQPLLEIVPEDTLEVEASVENKDIGFVEEGQDAVIKIEAFPYSRFGYLRGKVLSVSNNAIENRRHVLQYTVRVGLPANHMLVGKRQLNLTPGMQVTVEILTGRRTVAEYFLSPFVETVGQSMIER